MFRANRFNALAGHAPDKPGRHVEKFAGRPFRFRRLVSPSVEKPSAIIEGEPPFGFRNARRLLAIEARPCVQIDGRHAIRGEAGPFIDFGGPATQERPASRLRVSCFPFHRGSGVTGVTGVTPGFFGVNQTLPVTPSLDVAAECSPRMMARRRASMSALMRRPRRICAA